ncbi:heat shock protein 30C-like [Heptranchias perlo]|uniref:heat shock protein 30C-like n=1 Tax=Heptranchias perlo TaxID=212740 RepID=UPI003559F2AB
MLSCRAFHPTHLCQLPGLTLRPVPHSVFELLKDNMWKPVEEARKTMDWVHEQLLRELLEERSKNQDNRPDDYEESKTQSEGQDRDGFSLSLDVQRFAPEELMVKVLGRKMLVTGKHETKSDDGSGCYSYNYEELRREFQLPEDVDPQALNCCLSQDGQLKVQAPRLALPAVNEQTVPSNITSDTTITPRPNSGKEPQRQNSGKPEGNKKEAETKKDF